MLVKPDCACFSQHFPLVFRNITGDRNGTKFYCFSAWNNFFCYRSARLQLSDNLSSVEPSLLQFEGCDQFEVGRIFGDQEIVATRCAIR